MFATENQIVDSFNKCSNIKGMNTFIGIVLMLIYGDKLQENYLSVSMKNFQKHLDEVLYLKKEKPERNIEKKWFVLLHKEWFEEIKKLLLDGKKISASDLSIVLFWNQNFPENQSPFNYLKEKINDDLFFNSIFFQEDSLKVNSTVAANAAALHSALGGGENYTYHFGNQSFIQKPAGDLSSAPFGQTLYANLELRHCFILADYDFYDRYGFDQPTTSLAELNLSEGQIALPKPFILLAGISGTGKSKFVRNQARRDSVDGNFLLVPVRPDWHEPSDLLGYVSRIGDSAKYIPTAFLVFIVNAWKAIYVSHAKSEINARCEFTLRPLNSVPTFWVCLDEMNLAPVEQYFADYLSVVETRSWDGGLYSCDALIDPAELLNGENPSAIEFLRKSLSLEGRDDLWACFLENGIPLPPNLIVAGTVNMDETTHGFSRKVIDRALTFDFGDFFPNDFDKYFAEQNLPKSLTFPRFSKSNKSDLKKLVPADPDGSISTNFMKEINQTLKGTSFEMAFRALNELLVSLMCFMPKDTNELKAVWDDFLMFKLLPRLEGDEDKLLNSSGQNILDALLEVLEQKFQIETNQSRRIDLFSTSHSGQQLFIPYRSPAKLSWMRKRLSAGFTSFWP